MTTRSSIIIHAAASIATLFAVVLPTTSDAGTEAAKSHQAIRAGVRELQARGVKVVMSINGRPNWEGHAGGWDNLDPEAFAANVKAIVVDQWGLDGVDLDNEAASVIPGANFVQVIKALRRALGPDALVTLPVFLPKRDAYLSQVREQISFVSTMAYWLGYERQLKMFDPYAELVGPEKVAFGVADAANLGQNSTLEAAARLAAWDPKDTHKAGMMLWNLNQPSSQQTTAQWCAAIADNLP